jgi:hypothetical protein
MGARSVPTDEAAFVAKIREQIRILRAGEHNYDQLRVYVSGIADPWVFGPDDEFEFEGEAVLVVRDGPTAEMENEEVPEYVFPLRHIVATELASARGEADAVGAAGRGQAGREGPRGRRADGGLPAWSCGPGVGAPAAPPDRLGAAARRRAAGARLANEWNFGQQKTPASCRGLRWAGPPQLAA